MSRLSIPIGSDDHTQGDRTALRSLVEYGDYECPSCGQIQPVIREIQKHFGKRLLFAFRNFPLSELHPWAEAAAEAAAYASKHGKFWEMHYLLFENQDRLSGPLVLELADRIGLSSSELSVALEKKTYRSRVRIDFDSGIRSGVNGTPTLFINDERYDGLLGFDSVVDEITHVLAASKV